MMKELKAPEPDTKPMVLYMQALRGSIMLVVSGPEYIQQKVPGVQQYSDKCTKRSVYFELPGRNSKVRVDKSNVGQYGFASVPELLTFVQDPRRLMGMGGHPRYLYSIALGEQTTYPETMDIDALKSELHSRTRQRPSRDLSREGAVLSVRALRALCGEDCEPPDWVKGVPVVKSAEAEPERTLTDEVLRNIRQE